MMRAKMKVTRTEAHNPTSETITMTPVSADKYPDDGSDENNTYAKFTPSGSLSLTIANPALLGKFEIGQVYYLDFTKVA